MKGRKTGGRRKGAKNKKTLAEEAAREAIRAELTDRYRDFIDGLCSRAKGVRYFVTRNKKTGKYELVTNPDQVIAALNGDDENSGEFYTEKPDVQAIREGFDRMIGRPKEQPREVDVKGKLTLSLEELVAGSNDLNSRDKK